MKKKPIVFAFDEAYALPASIAIQSLIESKHKDTEYDIFVLHDALDIAIQKKMETITNITWVQVPEDIFKNAPSSESWSRATYYRLIVPELIPQYDAIIWSDVDVLFRGDLSSLYSEDLEDADWAGVIAEKNIGTDGIHTRFEENTKEFIYMAGFMLIDAKKWREENMYAQFLEIIDRYSTQLKFLDLDVLNLASRKIKSISFAYCVLENIFDSDDISEAPEYIWLSQTYSDNELYMAKEHPIIIHYAGKAIKIWKRKYSEIPEYYWKYILASPFFKKEHYFNPITKRLKNIGLLLLIKITFLKRWRVFLREKRKLLMDIK